MTAITSCQTRDARFDLPDGAGSDAVHTDPQYGYAVTKLISDQGHVGIGLAYTLGDGTDLICRAVELLAGPLIGRDIESLMDGFGVERKSLADHPQLRWLGPHKGVVHSALASLTNACFDLWAKHRQVPLWRLLLDLDADAVVRLLDLSYLEDVLPRQDAVKLLEQHRPSRSSREAVLHDGYPGYDTSVGWFRYSDERIEQNAKRAVDTGFTALKLKVGGADLDHDVRRAELVRRAVGDDVRIMLDANQAWSLPRAFEACRRLAEIAPFWIEEPTHPDDVVAHRELARRIAPVPVAVGECVPNRVMWKNFLQEQAVGIVQADCTRLAGVSEFLAVALLAKRYPVQVVPHVGDMGQIHQHLVLFNHIALNHDRLFLEHIPHLREHFVHPALVADGCYHTPQEPGSGAELIEP